VSLASSSIALLLIAACAPAPPPARSTDSTAGVAEQRQVRAQADSLVRLHRSALSGLNRPARQVIADSVRWAETWPHLQPRGSTPTALPVVDFSRSMVVIAALGDQPSTGYGVIVDSVVRTKSEYLMFVRATEPGDCIVGGLETQPVDVVAVPRSHLPARFVEQRVTSRC